MVNFPIALQLYSVRNEVEKDFSATLKKVREMNYDGVEFAGLYNHKPEEVKRMLEELGLNPVSAHVSYGEMLENPEKVMNDYKQIGCEFIAIPYMSAEYRPGSDSFAQTAENIKKLGRLANSYGLKLLYHNHDFEFQKIDGKYELDILYETIPADLLQTELDTCWVNVGGENPADYIRKYAGRSPVVHLKDFMMPGKKPAKMYALLGIDDDQKATGSDAFEYRPIGYGAQDVPEILRAAKDAGTKWIIVEQDDPSMKKTPIECAEMSIKFLRYLK